jgi:acetyltransferase-like isoleucine patch superfamily enzyme
MEQPLRSWCNNQGKWFYVHPTAIIEPGCEIGEGTKIWHFAHIRPTARIGKGCNIGKGVYVEGRVGDHCKLQNNVNVYHGAHLGDYVFMGPNSTTTNDMYPDARNPNWTCVPTYINNGVAIGAGAVIVCGVEIGEGTLVAAGAVVTTNLAPNIIAAGNPARKLRGRA